MLYSVDSQSRGMGHPEGHGADGGGGVAGRQMNFNLSMVLFMENNGVNMSILTKGRICLGTTSSQKEDLE